MRVIFGTTLANMADWIVPVQSMAANGHTHCNDC